MNDDDAEEEQEPPSTPPIEADPGPDMHIVCFLCDQRVTLEEYSDHLSLHTDVFPSILLVMGPEGLNLQIRGPANNDDEAAEYEYLTELGELIGTVPRGFHTTEARARVMNGFTLARADGTLCVVCQDALQPETDVAELLCGHLFCRGCIDQWLRVSKRCPVCSAEMDSLLDEAQAAYGGVMEPV